MVSDTLLLQHADAFLTAAPEPAPLHTGCPCLCRSFFHSGVFIGVHELFVSQLAGGQQEGGALWERFNIQCMLFINNVLKCAPYRATSGSFEMSSAARSEVGPVLHDRSGCAAAPCSCELVEGVVKVLSNVTPSVVDLGSTSARW